MAGNLRDHVAEQFRQRKAERDISSALIDQGYTPDYVEKLIHDVKQYFPGVPCACRVWPFVEHDKAQG